MEGSELERLVVELMELVRGRFYGKYRGIVEEVDDSQQLGRVRAQVPEILGDETSPWALPCVPFAGANHGLVLLPEVGDGVWIEFEAGDPSRPVWTGGWWGTDEMSAVGGTQVRAFVTSAGHKIVIDEENSVIDIAHNDGSTVKIEGSQMTLESGSGKVVLSNSGVDINNSALTVS